MPNVKIHDLSAASAVTDSMQFEVDTAGTTSEKVTGAQIKSYIGGRETLTANRIYYVRSDGNDSNDGLTNSSGGAFLTWPGAINAYSSAVDHAGYNVTIQAGVASQTFSIGASLVLKKAVGTGTLTLDFDGGILQSSGTLTDNGPTQRCLVEALGVNDVTLKDVTLTHTNYSTNGPWNVAIRAGAGCNITFDGVNFGDLASTGGFSRHIIAETNGYIFCKSPYTISGGAGASNGDGIHYLIRNDGIFSIDDTITVTLSGSPKFNTFCNVAGAKWIGYQTTFSGSLASGCTKHSVTGNGVINTFGGSAATFFPGSVSGSAATGGQFL
jgi:hypothetical protein